jgi:ADP-dependent phosphofructokinase/glucokinase
MQKGHEIVKKVLDKFPALSEELHRLFKKSAVWYRSHGYPLRKDDPLQNGNLSAVDHLLRMADEYEAAMPGAGQELGEQLAAEFKARYRCRNQPCDDRAIRLNLTTEFYQAMREIDKADLSEQSELQLARTDKELSEIEKAIGDARAHVRAEWRAKQAS